MFQVFKRELRANLRSLIFWCVGMASLAGVGYVEYRGMAHAEGAVDAISNMMPRIVRVMFGMAAAPLDTPLGYYLCMYLWLSFLAYIHAAMLGAGILSKEERDKTADFLFTRPYPRPALVAGKVAAGLVNVLVLNLAGWATTLAAFLPQLDGLNFAPEINRTMLGMLFTQVIFFFAGLLFAAAVRDNRRATSLAAGSVIVTYLVMVLIEMAKADALDFLSPFRYFNAFGVVDSGMRPLYLLLSAVLVAVMGFFSFRQYARRDLKA